MSQSLQLLMTFHKQGRQARSLGHRRNVLGVLLGAIQKLDHNLQDRSGMLNMRSYNHLQGGKWEEVYEEVAAREMEILNTLTNGQALEEHMEDFYLEVGEQLLLVYNPSLAASPAPPTSKPFQE